MPTTTTLPDGLLDKVRALLAQAESTTFPAEAEAFFAKANALMARYAIDAALLDSTRSDRGKPISVVVNIENPYASAKMVLLNGIAQPYRCRLVATGKRTCQLFGYESDVETVQLLFTSLLMQATSEMLATPNYIDPYDGKDRTKAWRNSFIVAFAAKVSERLEIQLAETIATVEREAAEGTGAEWDDLDLTPEDRIAIEAGERNLLPVLASRIEDVDRAVAEEFPRLRQRSVSSSSGSGHQAGNRAGSRADIGNRRVGGNRQELNA